jgi:hypothetical protein
MCFIFEGLHLTRRIGWIAAAYFCSFTEFANSLLLESPTFIIDDIRSALDGECGFLAANLYAKSVFGEDALVNISIEKQLDGKLSGYIRIRSKTQGIALSLGAVNWPACHSCIILFFRKSTCLRHRRCGIELSKGVFVQKDQRKR